MSKPFINGDSLDRYYNLFEDVVRGIRPPSELKAALPDSWDGQVNWLGFVVQAHVSRFTQRVAHEMSSEGVDART